MKELFPLKGIVTVLNTPFKITGEIDFLALKSNVSEALNAGVAGFLVPAMASEVLKLSFEERLEMVDHVQQTVDGKVPVFVGTSSPTITETEKILKSYLELGCKHILIQIPFLDEQQFKRDFIRLAELGPEVIMLQDWDASGYGLPDHLIMDLFETVPAFRCLKVETNPAGVKYSRMLEQLNGLLNISGGWAVNQIIEGLERGVHAFMPTGMHWIYTRIFQNFQQGKISESTTLFHEILPVLAFSNQHLDTSIHFFKRLLWKQGIYPTPNVRQPILPFDEIHRKIADKLIQKVIFIEDKIKNPNQSKLNND